MLTLFDSFCLDLLTKCTATHCTIPSRRWNSQPTRHCALPFLALLVDSVARLLLAVGVLVQDNANHQRAAAWLLAGTLTWGLQPALWPLPSADLRVWDLGVDWA